MSRHQRALGTRPRLALSEIETLEELANVAFHPIEEQKSVRFSGNQREDAYELYVLDLAFLHQNGKYEITNKGLIEIARRSS